MWDERFSQPEYVYGKNPNDFLASVFEQIPAGRVLCLCEGEGRNGCFLAAKGYEVTGVDGSKVGLHKARQLAEEKGVKITFIHSDLANYHIEPDMWQGIVSIFAHLPKDLRTRIHQEVITGLTKGGVFILEGYTPRQLKYDTGGPQSSDLLYEPEDLKQELRGLNLIIAQEIEREIIEGHKHTGTGAVFQVLAKK